MPLTKPSIVPSIVPSRYPSSISVMSTVKYLGVVNKSLTAGETAGIAVTAVIFVCCILFLVAQRAKTAKVPEERNGEEVVQEEGRRSGETQLIQSALCSPVSIANSTGGHSYTNGYCPITIVVDTQPAPTPEDVNAMIKYPTSLRDF
eukprot:gene1551-2996_t